MDYGIVAPGPDVDQGRVTHLFNLRSLFTVLNVSQPNVAVVSDLVSFVNNDSSVTRPIGNLFLGAHSNNEGVVLIQMALKQARASNGKFYSDYETLDAATDTGSLVVNDSTVSPDPTQHFLYFKGCNLGRAIPFLQKWKLALGGKMQVSAPRFNHGAFTDQGRGVWEFMMYEFVVHSPIPVAGRDLLIQQFQGAHFTYLEAVGRPGNLIPGPPIPDNMWGHWLPSTIGAKVNSKTGVAAIAHKEYPQYRSFNVQALALPFATLDVDENFTVDQTVFRKKIPGLNPMPTANSDRLAALRTFLLADVENRPHISRYTDAHPFPMYQRLGYADFDSFIAGFTWHFSNKDGSSDLFVRGTRERYTLLIGVTDPNPGAVTTDSQLLTNFYPTGPGFLSGNQLPVTDQRFFQAV
jgi:hypothetical protein